MSKDGNQPGLLTVTEVKNWAQLSERSIRGLVAKKAIPHVYIGRSLRFSSEELQAWIRQRTEGGDR